MAKIQANYRIDSEQKKQAEAVLVKIGLRPTDAVNMFMHHIAMFGELPFKPSVPNVETLQVFQETDLGIGLTRHKNIDEIFEKIND